jgi:hypothetical protein
VSRPTKAQLRVVARHYAAEIFALELELAAHPSEPPLVVAAMHATRIAELGELRRRYTYEHEEWRTS